MTNQEFLNMVTPKELNELFGMTSGSSFAMLQAAVMNAGAQARLRIIHILAVQASITFHQSRYEGGDVIVTQYPVELTAMLYIIPVGPIRPYILGGVG